MVMVPIWHKGEVARYAVVDSIDAEYVAGFRWLVGGSGYALRRCRGTTVYMHREIAGVTKGVRVDVDHIDHDPFNNQRANLRVVTHAENMRRRRPWSHKARKAGVA